MSATTTQGGLTVAQVADITMQMIAAYELPTPDSVDFAASVTPANHVARMEAQKLHARLLDTSLADVERWDILATFCQELVDALPAVFPWRTPETYDVLRDLVRGLGGLALNELMRLKHCEHAHP